MAGWLGQNTCKKWDKAFLKGKKLNKQWNLNVQRQKRNTVNYKLGYTSTNVFLSLLSWFVWHPPQLSYHEPSIPEKQLFSLKHNTVKWSPSKPRLAIHDKSFFIATSELWIAFLSLVASANPPSYNLPSSQKHKCTSSHISFQTHLRMAHFATVLKH